MKWFAVCEDCGSTDWIELNHSGEGSTPNSLNDEGDVLVPNNLNNLFKKSQFSYRVNLKKGNVLLRDDTDLILCDRCEAHLFPIAFKDVDKSLRRRIYFMSIEAKKEWVAQYRTAQTLSYEVGDD